MGEGARLGDYVVHEELRAEQTGVVYLAKHVVLPRFAAIKVMHPSENWLRALAVQMLREACVLEALTHPGIPRVYECGVLADKRPWTAFEAVDGTSVEATLAAGPMAVADVVVLVRDVADILDHIHRRGIVHHRLDADAVVLTPGARFPVSIRSWGDVCALDSEARVIVHPLDDVQALGSIAFRALTGVRPDAAEPTQERYPGAPRDVAALIDAMLAHDREARPTSAEVRDRARWLTETLEQVPVIDRPRWTPARGVHADVMPTSTDELGPGLTIRIAGRSPTRG